MKKFLIVVASFFIIISLIGIVSFLQMKTFGHMEFVIKELKGIDVDDYLTDDKAAFLCVNDVAVLHSIQLEAINGKDAYPIGIRVFTKDVEAIITLKSYCLSEKETVKVLFSLQN